MAEHALDDVAVLGGLDIEGQSNLRRRLLWMTTVVAGLMFQRRERVDRWCSQYFDALQRQQNPELAKLTATVTEGFSIDVGKCHR